MINNIIIENLFPTPVYFNKLERSLTKKEIICIDKYSKDTHKNTGNIVSNDTYVLENKCFKKLKQDLLLRVKDYFDKILHSKNVIPYITQSWLNFTEINQYHHTHEHPNSVVSGVFYINADKTNDSIEFHKRDRYQAIRPSVTKYNQYNCESWWFPVETLDIILFPSSLTHHVNFKKGNNTRISLAFNVFVKGILGDKTNLTELKL